MERERRRKTKRGFWGRNFSGEGGRRVETRKQENKKERKRRWDL
jgi:hypothetical protein